MWAYKRGVCSIACMVAHGTRQVRYHLLNIQYPLTAGVVHQTLERTRTYESKIVSLARSKFNIKLNLIDSIKLN